MSSSHVQSVSDLAFNVSIVAYDFGYPGRTPNHRLALRKITKTKNIASLLATETTTTPALEPSQAEIHLSEEHITGLWVGMRPSAALQYTQAALRPKAVKRNKAQADSQDVEDEEPASKKRRTNLTPKKGGSVNQNSGYTKLEFDPNALRVIAPFDRDNANYYALVNPQDGLCTGYPTPIKEVFFFKEFRDDTSTSFQNRVTSWGRIVRNALDCQQRISWTRNYDKTKFHVDQKRSLANELAALIATYRMRGDKSVLRMALDLIDSADKDRSLWPLQENVMLYKLVNEKVVLSLDECDLALKELQKSAPELGALSIQADEVLQMSTALCESEIVLEHRLLRAFVVDFIRELRRSSEIDLPALATAAWEHVLLQMGPVPVHAEVKPNGFRSFLAAEAAKLKEFPVLVRLTTEALKDSQGSHAASTAPTLPQAWSKFGASPDMDSAKLFGTHIHRFNVQALSKTMQPVREALEKNVELLDKLRISLPEDQLGSGESKDSGME